jgi:hypothetical protein
MRVWRFHFKIARDWPFIVFGFNRFIDTTREPFIAFY